MEFIQGLTPKEQAKILREIDLLKEFGLALGLPYIKKMQGNYNSLWELRIKHSSNDFRIFYFVFSGGKFILLHAIRKTSEKTPKKHLETSMRRMKNYLERM
ncbi:MAG: type II toxin-antitoxin system RelE/ParE family toxin [Firmicutes bacterium]|nr:type II toxin-antitoxin system RelE/ParE family toxin [Bacillota bacterium]